MTLSGRPLLDNRLDQPLFVAREPELAALSAALNRGLNVLVTGDLGIGKTSLLNALRYRTRPSIGDTDADAGVGVGAGAGAAVTYVRAEGITEGSDLLRLITEAVLGRTAIASRPDDGSSVLGALSRLSDALDEAEAPAPRIVIVDDVTATAGHALFGRLRDELWSLPVRWVVAARTGERGGLTLPPADAFFEQQVILSPLGADDAAEMLRRRLPNWPQVVLDRVVAAIGGTPRALLDAVRTIADPTSDRVEPVLAALRARDDAIARAGRPEAMLAAELDAIGAASASDEQLLTRLGWTRARAVQVLTRLEELGLVRGDDVKSGRGRPRKVYRLVSPAEFDLSVG